MEVKEFFKIVIGLVFVLYTIGVFKRLLRFNIISIFIDDDFGDRLVTLIITLVAGLLLLSPTYFVFKYYVFA